VTKNGEASKKTNSLSDEYCLNPIYNQIKQFRCPAPRGRIYFTDTKYVANILALRVSHLAEQERHNPRLFSLSDRSNTLQLRPIGPSGHQSYPEGPTYTFRATVNVPSIAPSGLQLYFTVLHYNNPGPRTGMEDLIYGANLRNHWVAHPRHKRLCLIDIQSLDHPRSMKHMFGRFP